MLQIQDLTYRIAGKTLLDNASARVPAGHKVGIVGKNGAGKSTLLKLITEELHADDGTIQIHRLAKLGQVAQEAPGGATSLLDTVLEADLELKRLEQAAKTETDPTKIAEIHLRLADIDAHTAEARAASILSGLGFDGEAQRRPCSSFSGGWRMRVALACTLFTRPDLLLLDEPTNYLDLEGVMWLENFIKNYPFTVIIVSHDRDLLNSSVTAILHLEQQQLKLYTGNYDNFEKLRREQLAHRRAGIVKQEAAQKHLQSFIDRFKAKASKAKQAQSRVKMLEKMGPLDSIIEDRTFSFEFPNPKPLAPPLFTLDNGEVGYSAGNPILRRLNLRLDMDDRIALLGQNGNGKSTFAKLISGRLDIMNGELKKSGKLEVGYFAQHQLDELNPEGTPLSHLKERMVNVPESKVRAKLGAFSFGVDKAMTRVEDLSGGEKARLLFALMSLNAPHILILDEPTNHLDVESREALIHAINGYEGAVIMISHDRHLIEACADRLWLVNEGTVTSYDGDMEDYKKLTLQSRSTSKKKSKENPGGQKVRSEDPQLTTLKKKAEKLEKKIKRLQADVAKYDRALKNPKLYVHGDVKAAAALKKFTAEKLDMTLDLEEFEVEWLEMQEAIEEMSA
ncbi:ABC-F family ATP-binding cassette domain-containing protein [Paremcibacter congregatus]|uniref:ABC-F family ATP-binding cassette domain-containing protein n=1 Tax=Paremcibacter congregatus TaxID=2043170 RepID=UPI0030EBC319|tara:strand:- start:4600 stop:6468 length:1869 start_codon:yes stop_codon:yes gene_type:complete